jgi:hypothetical protein
MLRNLAGMAIVGAIALTSACAPATETTNATNAGSNANVATANTNSVPAPAFEPGSPQAQIANQPDYSADVTLATDITMKGKVAKHGKDWRIELPVPMPGSTTPVQTIMFVRSGQPTIMVMPDRKQYLELPVGQDAALANPIAAIIDRLQQSGTKFEQVGTETVDGHPTNKYRVSKEGETGEAFVYVAQDLRNMVIKIDGSKENKSGSITWTNIALDPPATLIEPPADLATAYKKVDLPQIVGGAAGGAGAGSTTPPAGNTNSGAGKSK